MQFLYRASQGDRYCLRLAWATVTGLPASRGADIDHCRKLFARRAYLLVVRTHYPQPVEASLSERSGAANDKKHI